VNTKKIQHLLVPLILLIHLHPCAVNAQKGQTRGIIMSAMMDEMERSVRNLRIEDMERPFFISYNIYDANTMEVVAALGSIVRSDENHRRNHNVRVMVGDYSLNDENFQGAGTGHWSSMIHGSAALPLEDDYDGIRRSLWIATDNTYKRAAELFELKKAALKQQTMREEAALDDFSRTPVITYTESPRIFEFERSKWEKNAEELSGMFRAYPDIYSSEVRILFYQGDMLFSNSEGTNVIQPLTLCAVQVNAYTQAVDGEPLSNHFAVYRSVPEELPALEEMKQSVTALAEELVALRSAPVFEDSYFGPVLLDGTAVVEFFSQRLFSGKSGLIAYRRPITGNTGGIGYREEDATLEDRIDRRILSRDITIKALPGLARYRELNLIGSFSVDTEGVKPPEELVLVENGMLKTLLTNRTPTLKVRESNGHQRPYIGSGYWASGTLGPGVISITSSEGKTGSELKEELLRRAREEELEYGILIRKLKPYITGAQSYDPMVRMTYSYGRRDGMRLSEPVMMYRVYVEDGREELVRSAQLGSVSLSTLRHIAGVSEESIVVNTLSTVNWNSGIPTSFIVPQSLILEELEVKNEKREYTPKLPAVPSPLTQK